MSGEFPLDPAESAESAETPAPAHVPLTDDAPDALAPRGLHRRSGPAPVPVPVPVPPRSGTRPRGGPGARVERSRRARMLPLGVALSAGLLLFAATSYAVLGAGADVVDRPVLSAVVRHRQAVLDGPVTFLTHASEIPLLVLAVLLALWLSWRDRSWQPPLLIGGASALAVTAATVAKEITDRTRPPARLWEISENGYCFPSRHAVTATAVLLVLAYVLAARAASRVARIALWSGAAVLSLLAGGSRVYLGVHWPTDVIGGLTLGTVVTLLVILVHKLWEAPRPGHPSR
ncbi:phosphatase PAP2 family protein [Streptomyces smyrnaeus]|uniref:phosphatase PAP2 family protein n=1 Tax=Streptomyces smyrnaeus TaxID=1387713 RepID=UPI003400F37E